MKMANFLLLLFSLFLLISNLSSVYAATSIDTISSVDDALHIILKSDSNNVYGSLQIFGQKSDKVVLNQANKFSDILEDSASITKNGANSPVIGKNVVFSCGACGIATFDDSVTQIGGNQPVCGYTTAVPRQIVENDDQLCARTTYGTLFNIDFLSWSAQGSCTDADGGTSCDEAKNQTSYIRSTEKSLFSTGIDNLPKSESLAGIGMEIGKVYYLDYKGDSETIDRKDFIYSGEKGISVELKAATEDQDEPATPEGSPDSWIKISKLDIRVGSKTDGSIQDKKEGYEIRHNAKPGDKLSIYAKVQNVQKNNDSLDDVFMNIRLEGIDDGDDIEEESTDYSIKSAASKDFRVQLEIPKLVEEDDYDLIISFEGEDESGNRYSLEKNMQLSVEKDEHELVIDSLKLMQPMVSCNQVTEVQINIMNLGQSDENNVKVSAESQIQAITLEPQESSQIVLESGIDSGSKSNLNVKVDAGEIEPGKYPIQVKVFRDGSILADSKNVVLTISKCKNEAIKKVNQPARNNSALNSANDLGINKTMKFTELNQSVQSKKINNLPVILITVLLIILSGAIVLTVILFIKKGRT